MSLMSCKYLLLTIDWIYKIHWRYNIVWQANNQILQDNSTHKLRPLTTWGHQSHDQNSNKHYITLPFSQNKIITQLTKWNMTQTQM